MGLGDSVLSDSVKYGDMKYHQDNSGGLAKSMHESSISHSVAMTTMVNHGKHLMSEHHDSDLGLKVQGMLGSLGDGSDS